MIRVLVAEDSPTVMQMLVHLLEEDGEVEVVAKAENGRQALEMAARTRPDVITMDVMMPDMDGIEATRRIMAQCPTPIVVVTAHADSREPNFAFEAIKAGALEVVAKPRPVADEAPQFWGSALLETVKRVAEVKMDHLKN